MTVLKKRSLLLSLAIVSILAERILPWLLCSLVSMICFLWLAVYAYKARANSWITIFGFAAAIYSPAQAGYLIPFFSVIDWNYLPVRLAVVAVLSVSWFTLELPDEFYDKWV